MTGQKVKLNLLYYWEREWEGGRDNCECVLIKLHSIGKASAGSADDVWLACSESSSRTMTEWLPAVLLLYQCCGSCSTVAIIPCRSSHVACLPHWSFPLFILINSHVHSLTFFPFFSFLPRLLPVKENFLCRQSFKGATKLTKEEIESVFALYDRVSWCQRWCWLLALVSRYLPPFFILLLPLICWRCYGRHCRQDVCHQSITE